MNRNDILANAQTIINGNRVGQYGSPEDSFEKIARLWSVFLNRDITSADVANMMILMKVARNANGVYKDDNWIDICGYAAIGGEIQARNVETDDKDDEKFFENRLEKGIEESFSRWCENEAFAWALDSDQFGSIMAKIISGKLNK